MRCVPIPVQIWAGSFFQRTVQCQVLLIPLKSINPSDIVQPAVILDNICRDQVGAVIHLKQHFFLVIDGCRREYLLAGQVAKVRPHCPHAFKGGCGYAHFIPCTHLPQQFDFTLKKKRRISRRTSGTLSPSKRSNMTKMEEFV